MIINPIKIVKPFHRNIEKKNSKKNFGTHALILIVRNTQNETWPHTKKPTIFAMREIVWYSLYVF